MAARVAGFGGGHSVEDLIPDHVLVRCHRLPTLTILSQTYD